MSMPPTLPSASSKSRRFGWLAFALGLGCVLVIAPGLYLWKQPRWYAARVTFEEVREELRNELRDGGFYYNPPPPRNVALRQPEVLDRVVQMLELTKVYGRDGRPATIEQARDELRRATRYWENSGAPQIRTVEAYDRAPHMAAYIANSMAVAYRDHRLKLLEKQLERSLSQYTDEVSHQRKLVRTASEDLQEVRERDQVIDPDQEQRGSAVTGQETKAYVEMKEKYMQAKRILENAEIALGKARLELKLDSQPVRILERAVPPAKPLAWWRGDPRR